MASPTGLAQRLQRGPPHRSVTLPPRLNPPTSPDQQPAAPASSDAIETLFECARAKIVSFKVPEPRSAGAIVDRGGLTPESSPAGVFSWRSDLERTISTGPLRLYRVRGSAAFLNSGAAVHPILSKSQCWCVDGESTFVLRVGGNSFWRIELVQDSLEQRRLVADIKEVLANVLQYETTPCPFKRAFHVELPTNSPTIKRPWRPRQPSESVLPSEADTPVVTSSSQNLKSGSYGRLQDSSEIARNGVRTSNRIDSADMALCLSPSLSQAGVEHRVEEYESLCTPERTTPRPPGPFLGPTEVEVPERTCALEPAGAVGKATMEGPPEDKSVNQSFMQERPRSTVPLTSETTSSFGSVTSTVIKSPESVLLAAPTDVALLNPTSEVFHGELNSLATLDETRLDAPSLIEPQSTNSSQTFAAAKPRASLSYKSATVRSHTSGSETASCSSSLDSFHSMRSSPPISPTLFTSAPRRSKIAHSERERGRSAAYSAPRNSGVDGTLFRERGGGSGASSTDGAPRVALVDPVDLRQGQEPQLLCGEPGVCQSRDYMISGTIRRRFQSRRRYSPSPEAANLYEPSTRGAGSYLTSHVLQKTCSLLLGPPVQVVALMLNLAARIAGGALQGGVFTYDTRGRPVPCSWDLADEEDYVSDPALQDDYGIRLVGRRPGALRTDADSLSAHDLD